MTNRDTGTEQLWDAPADTARRPVYAVGIGPGDPAYLTVLARRVLDDADVVVGFETVVDRIRQCTDADLLECSYEREGAMIERFADRVDTGEKGAATLMGDPNLSGYTFLDKVEEAVGRSARILPGVSSIQVAASRARTPIEESTIVTLHKRGELEREFDRIVRDAGTRNVLILPRPYDWMPEDIASLLVDRGVESSLETVVFERLTFEDEETTRTSLGALAAEPGDETSFTDLSILTIRCRS